jgi:PAS domain S-box-containing protein
MNRTDAPSAPPDRDAWSGETDRTFERSLNPTLLIDDDRRYVDVNDAACSFLGLTRDQVVGRRIDEFLVPDVRKTLAETWPRFLHMGRHAGFFELVRPDGSVRKTMYSSIANVTPGRHLTVYLLDGDRKAPGNGGGGRARTSPELSPRQREVIELVAEGLTSTEIAERLGVSPETVRTHLRNARLKLGASTKAQAVAIAMLRDEIQLSEPR